VIQKNVEKNEIVVGTAQEMALYSKELIASHWHWIGNPLPFPFQAKAKIRYRQPDQEVILEQNGESSIRAVFTDSQRAITSGQTIAAYRDDELI